MYLMRINPQFMRFVDEMPPKRADLIAEHKVGVLRAGTKEPSASTWGNVKKREGKREREKREGKDTWGNVKKREREKKREGKSTPLSRCRWRAPAMPSLSGQ